MDKRVIFSVAGSGKTTHIVDSLSSDKRSLIVTYTTCNYDNLQAKIANKFDGNWPENITLMTYFSFLYRFCYKPFLADKYKARGLFFGSNPDKRYNQRNPRYYMTGGRYLYSNRLALLIEKNCVIDDVRARLIKYFDEFIIDEVQDIAGRDFTFLEHIMATELSMLFVGDFYQHTFDTSRDGNANSSLFDRKDAYETRFTAKGFILDNTTLRNSWRCSKSVCEYVTSNLGIPIGSNRSDADNTQIVFIADDMQINEILNDEQVIKFHYQNAAKAGVGHRNWGDTKGEDCYHDVCVLLNKNTAQERNAGNLQKLPPRTKNKLYVAITRARGNVYLIDESRTK